MTIYIGGVGLYFQNYTYRLTKDADERFRSYYDLNEDNIKAGKFEHFVGMLNKNPVRLA